MYVLLFAAMSTEKRGRGQPKKDIKADSRINLRVLDDQKKAWELAAQKEGLKLSAWLKKLADEASSLK